MSFPRYPKYKSSGVEWLGEVPEGWGVAPLKTVASHNDDTIDENTDPDTEILYVDISGVDSLDGIKTKEPMLFGAAPSRARRCVKHGDTIVSTVRTYLRAIAPVRNPENNLVVSTGFAVVRPRAVLLPDYLGNILSAGYFIEQVIARSTGVGYPAINASDLVRIPVAVPPLPEQTAIAEFLDRETGKIDGLVAEQRRLMELLKEKRQAVISHAVTKGLNPHAPMKPSGIEWLGDVPQHWEVTRLGFLCSKIGSGKTPLGGGEAYLTEGVLFIRSQNVYDEGLYLTDVVYVSEATDSEQSWSRVLAGDILLNITGASLGRTCLVPDNFGPANVNQHVCILRLASQASRQFVSMVLKSSGMKAQFNVAQNGAAREGLNFAQISKLALAVPPAAEQAEILKVLNTELAKFDTLTAEAQRAIDLLQERRTALISAAVTGQIDVRPQTQN